MNLLFVFLVRKHRKLRFEIGSVTEARRQRVEEVDLKLPPKPQSQIVAEAAAKKKVEKKKDVDMVRLLMFFVVGIAELPFSLSWPDAIFDFVCAGFRRESALSLSRSYEAKLQV